MDAKKLIEGLPVELNGNNVVISGYSYAKDYVSKQSEWHGAGPLLTLGWRVLLALMDEQEPGWKVGDKAICHDLVAHMGKPDSFTVGRIVTGMLPDGEQVLFPDDDAKHSGHNAPTCRHVPPPQQEPDMTRTASMPPACAIHNRQMVLRFYSRGPGDPPGNIWSCPDCVEEGQESLASASCLGGKTEITVESVRRQWEPGDSFVDDEEGNAHIRAVLNVSAGTIYATDGTRHRVAMCRHVDQPRDFFSGPEWDAVERLASSGPHEEAECLLSIRDYLLAKEKP